MCNINIRYYYAISGAKKVKGVKVQTTMLDKNMEEKKRKKKGNVILSIFLHLVYLTGAYTV